MTVVVTQNNITSDNANITALTASTVNSLKYPDAGPLSNRNKIINGDMRIDQRNAGASVSATAGVYPVDRFEIEHISGGGTATTQRSATVPTGQGFTNSLLVTVTGTDTSLASTDYYTIRQIIEGQNVADLQFGTNSASTVTISFWVRSSVTGTYCFSLTNGGNSRGYPVEYSISSANTWEKKTITIPGDITGTWGTDNGRGIQCRFCMGTGTSRQGTANTWNAGEIHGTSNQTNLFATNGATFYLTGVQLEPGTVATPFEHRSYGDELARCQRYYYKLGPVGSSKTLANASADSATAGWAIGSFPVTMRTSPTALEQSGTASDYVIRTGGGSRTCSAVPTFDNATTDGWMVALTVASGQTAGQAGFLRAASVTTAYLAWSAEL